MKRHTAWARGAGGLAVAVLLSAPAPAGAQAGTDIWLASLAERGGRLEVGVPVNITRRPGYDNQPYFTADGAGLLFTRIAEGQADIVRYDVAAATMAPVTRTPESEYSATPMPGGAAISVIRVEADSTQRLWRFPAEGSPAVIFADIAPVGYHAWTDASTAVLFVLGQPATLQVADTRTGSARVVAQDIGRSIQSIPGRRTVSFVQRTASGMRVDELDPQTDGIRPLIAARPGGEFHAWTPGGVLLMGEGARLFAWAPGAADWTLVADFGDLGLRLSRLAVSPSGDRIALVSDESPANR